MGIVVNLSPTWVQGASYIGWKNEMIADGAVVSASSQDSGFPVSNAASWLITGGGFRATATEVNINLTLPASKNLNSYALHKHNLGDLTATVKLQYSADAVTWTDVTGSEKNVADNKTIFFVFSPGQSAVFWRINITNVAASSQVIIGQAFIGNALQMYNPPEPGFTPPQLALNSKYINNRADGGDFLGRSLIRKGSEMAFSNSIVHKDWVRDNWAEVMASIEKYPFYYAWDSVNYPTEVAYCYVEGRLDFPKYVNSAYMSLGLKFKALQE